ncbi:MAG: mannose-1-phosphate guanylyltransferase [Clostridia bacterium]|nr:mannose-1-phosphate guanylyltransferase [Clostridia bacterium]
MDKYAVIMAGGGGTRFWPISRQHKPKQLLNISGNDVMINETIKRLLPLIDIRNIYIVTNEKQGEIIGNLIMKDFPKENILYEPVGRNTSACIAYAAFTIRKKSEDAVMCILPSDHYISDENRFIKLMDSAFRSAKTTDKLITIGIKPSFPSTGYGYIRYNKEMDKTADFMYPVEEFVEKPNITLAKSYLEDGNYLWNSGMFIWRASIILDNINRYMPRLYKSFNNIYEHIGTKSEKEMLGKIYPSLQSISIDYGILERSDDVMVIPGEFGWNDVGSWDSLGFIFPTDENGNIVKAKHIGLDTKNSIIYSSGKLIATIGLENLIIADAGDAILICPKEKAQDVKALVEKLKSCDMGDYI